MGIIAGVSSTKISGLIELVRDETDTRLPNAARFALAAIANQIEELRRQIDDIERRLFASQNVTRTCGGWLRYQVSER